MPHLMHLGGVSIARSLFFSIRAVWDAFISLSEKKQIELLGTLASSVDVSNSDDDDNHDNNNNEDDVDLGDDVAIKPPPRGYNNRNHARRHGSKGRSRRENRRKAAVQLQGTGENFSETTFEAFG